MTVGRARTSPRRRVPSPRRGRLGTQGGRAGFIGIGPTVWYDTRDLLTTTQQTLLDRVLGVKTAQLGATSGAEASDPVALVHTGESYLWCSDGSVGNYASIPDAANLDMTGDFEVIVRAYAPDWATAPAVQQTWAARFDGPTGATRAWSFRRAVTTNALNFLFQHPVSGLTTHTATLPVIPAGWAWFRVFVDTDNGAGSRAVTFQWAADQATEPTSWTTISTSTTGNTGAHSASSFPLVIGSDATASRGLLYGVKRVILRDLSVGSTTIADINPTVETVGHATWTATTGQTVTVTRAATGAATTVVTRPVLTFDGSADYLQLPAGDIPTFTATTGTHTTLVIARNRALAASGTLWSSESASNVGANLFLTSTGVVTARVGGATTTADATVGTGHDDDVTLNAFALVYDTGTVRAYRYGDTISAATDTTGVGTVTHAAAPRVGSRADSAAVLDRAEIVAVVQYARALTQTELDTASVYLVGSYS